MVTGFTHYKGYKAAQHFNFQNVFSPFLQEQKFDIIIEIGTLNGGLTKYFKDASPTSRIISFDVTPQPEHQKLISEGIEFRLINIFENGKVVDNDILNILSSNLKKLIVCDGGNKAFEFNCLARHMKSGDFIMAHDYSYDGNVFKNDINNKVWNWFEISEADIQGVSEEMNLIHHNKDEFQTIVWVCKKKI
jgi:hypothetical protein